MYNIKPRWANSFLKNSIQLKLNLKLYILMRLKTSLNYLFTLENNILDFELLVSLCTKIRLICVEKNFEYI